MIYDCFPFFNELDLLELRLQILENSVEKHVIVESPFTHSGKPKPLYYQDNKARFEKWQDKIFHVVYDPPANAANAWVREHGQRNAILQGLTEAQPDDWIIISDVDEIPAPNFIPTLEFCWSQMNTKRPVHLAMQMFMYYMNLRYILDWHFAAIAPYWLVKKLTPNEVRHWPMHCAEIIPECGWHFSYMGGREKVIEKMEAFAHHDEETNLRALERIKSGVDMVNVKHLVKVLPPKILRDKMKQFINAGFFQKYFKNEPDIQNPS